MRNTTLRFAASLACLSLALAACQKPAPEATGPKLPTEIGAGEGALSVVSWEGYAQDDWVKPFEAATGCKVTHKYAGSSDEMVALMRQNDGQYDVVSASGDATLRLIAGKNVVPVNTALIADYPNFTESLQSPNFNTVDGVHYGITYEWGPNTLLYNTKAVKTAPTSWASIYDAQYKGKVTVPDNAIQIADAALYLSKTKPELGITDPYELNATQMDAVVTLLKSQKPLIKKYWALASDEISLFANGDAVIGAAWPYQTNTLKANKPPVPVEDLVPSEGATGWADTWMISSKSAHPNCAYKWITGCRPRLSRPSRPSISVRPRSTSWPAPRWTSRAVLAPASNIMAMRRSSISTRSISGRPRKRRAAMARIRVWTMPSGKSAGWKSRGKGLY